MENPVEQKSDTPIAEGVIKPSSLNYKISIKEAARSFIKDSETLEVVVETTKRFNDEIWDDALFDMQVDIKQDWGVQDQKIRKKLEKNCINQIKYKARQEMMSQAE